MLKCWDVETAWCCNSVAAVVWWSNCWCCLAQRCGLSSPLLGQYPRFANNLLILVIVAGCWWTASNNNAAAAALMLPPPHQTPGSQQQILHWCTVPIIDSRYTVQFCLWFRLKVGVIYLFLVTSVASAGIFNFAYWRSNNIISSRYMEQDFCHADWIERQDHVTEEDDDDECAIM